MGKHKKKSKKSKRHYKSSSSSSSSSEDDWVEKDSVPEAGEKKSEKREEWMTLSSTFSLMDNEDRRKVREKKRHDEKKSAQYDPQKSSRELNPYWKNGGEGLPTKKFLKPDSETNYNYKTKTSSISNWRKKREKIVGVDDNVNEEKIVNELQMQMQQPLTEKEINELGAKIVKAEILGDTVKAKQLKEQLENARKLLKCKPKIKEKEQDVILYETNSKGFSKPLSISASTSDTKRKFKKHETHKSGKRQNYYPDDDKLSLKQMFEQEKFTSQDKHDLELMKLTSKTSKINDMDDIFVDKIRENRHNTDKEIKKAIFDHEKRVQSIDSCQTCLTSSMKHLIIHFGETVNLNLPTYVPLVQNHCLLSPFRHVSSITQLDENEYEELNNICKNLINIFEKFQQTVIFYETVLSVKNHRYHTVLNCIPCCKDKVSLLRMYFKKAIDECESEWSSNKKLIPLTKERDIRKSVPKELPYFFVSFGMENGFAHVIEDSKKFSMCFAAEIIAGVLDIDYSKWRKPKIESFEHQKERVSIFNKLWAEHKM